MGFTTYANDKFLNAFGQAGLRVRFYSVVRDLGPVAVAGPLTDGSS
jgi:hypothetical protein